LERFFHYNIFIFVRDENNEEYLSLPFHKESYHKVKNNNKCVFIYMHTGSESDNAEYPQCEININNIYKQLEDDSLLFNSIQISDNNNHHKNIFIKKNTTIDKITLIKEKINEYLLNIHSPLTTDTIYKLTDQTVKDIIVQIVSYYITEGNPNSIYNYGLHEKMLKKEYDINKEWAWVIEHYVPVKLTSNPYGLFNLNYIDQIDYVGVHRSGWQFVYDSLTNHHNESSDLYLDLYLDRTFHWNYEINKITNVVPYKKPWCGFIHHTFYTQFSIQCGFLTIAIWVKE
jgi:hypothetical protein